MSQSVCVVRAMAVSKSFQVCKSDKLKPLTLEGWVAQWLATCARKSVRSLRNTLPLPLQPCDL